MKNITINLSDEIKAGAPALKVVKLQAEIENRPTSEKLIALMHGCATDIKNKYELADINKRPGIASTRQAYKTFGKDPNRYRPSQEQLMRRIVNGKELYFLSNVVDVFNYISIVSGYSIGAFDCDKIDGDTLTLGVGRHDEPYEGIGRGILNIEGMPVYRDNKGGVGTPTSDNERTKTELDTKHLIVCINIYGEDMPVDSIIDLTQSMLAEYCDAKNISVETICAS